MKKEKNTKPEILTAKLRTVLKEIIQAEIIKLPEYLESMEPRQRVEIIIKLMPFVFPKTDPVHYEEGEKSHFSW